MSKSVKYLVTFDSKPEYSAVWEFSLEESGAFHYGNQTCVVITVDGKHHDMIDTRYEVGIVSNFEKWCEEYLTNNLNPDLNPNLDRLYDRNVIVGALYRHYKNHKTYKVLCEAKHSETGEALVIYEAMYDDHKIWARPKSMFLEDVTDTVGRTVPRFECLEVFPSA